MEKVKIIDYGYTLGIKRYNGGWIKTITGIDRTKNNGYSLVGEFVKINNDLDMVEPGLYVDCDISGSRKRHDKNYILIRITVEGKIIEIARIQKGSASWALQLWEEVEKELHIKDNPLVKFSDAELLAEIKKRNLV